MKTTRFLSLLLISILITTMPTPATVMAKKKKEKKVSTVHTPMKVVKKHLANLKQKGIELPWKGEFKPEKLVNKGEFSWILYRLYGNRLEEDNNSFGMIEKKPSKKYWEPIKWVLNAGVMDTGWDPETGVTRFGEKNIVDEYLFFYTTSRLARELEITPPKVREKVFKFKTNYTFDENITYELILEGKNQFLKENILWGIIRKPKRSNMLYIRDDLDRESLVIYLDRLTDIKGFRKDDGSKEEGDKEEEPTTDSEKTSSTLPIDNNTGEIPSDHAMGQLIEEEEDD